MCPAKVMVWIGKVLVLNLSFYQVEFTFIVSLKMNFPETGTIQAIFLIFELGVSILQFNLLIAMMTRTYETIFRTRKEYKRQVCVVASNKFCNLDYRAAFTHTVDVQKQSYCIFWTLFSYIPVNQDNAVLIYALGLVRAEVWGSYWVLMNYRGTIYQL